MRRDLVAEALADLGDPERELPPRDGLDLREVHEHALRGLRTQVRHVLVVLDRPEVRLEHQVELLGLGERGAPRSSGRHDPVRRGLQVVLAEALVAVEALHERIGEPARRGRWPPRRAGDMMTAASRPTTSSRSCTIDAPPGVADVATQFDAERAVVPGRAQPAVDLGGLERDPPSFGEGGDGLHEVGHGDVLLSRPLAATAGVRPWYRRAYPTGRHATQPSRASRAVQRPGGTADIPRWKGVRTWRPARGCGAHVSAEAAWCGQCFTSLRADRGARTRGCRRGPRGTETTAARGGTHPHLLPVPRLPHELRAGGRADHSASSR